MAASYDKLSAISLHWLGDTHKCHLLIESLTLLLDCGEVVALHGVGLCDSQLMSLRCVLYLRCTAERPAGGTTVQAW